MTGGVGGGGRGGEDSGSSGGGGDVLSSSFLFHSPLFSLSSCLSLSVFPFFCLHLFPLFLSFLPRLPPGVCQVQVRPSEERPAAHHQLQVSCAGVCGAVTANPMPYLHSHTPALSLDTHIHTHTLTLSHPQEHRYTGTHSSVSLSHTYLHSHVTGSGTHARGEAGPRAHVNYYLHGSVKQTLVATLTQCVDVSRVFESLPRDTLTTPTVATPGPDECAGGYQGSLEAGGCVRAGPRNA